jgi:SAM-dependent methyltransferase
MLMALGRRLSRLRDELTGRARRRDFACLREELLVELKAELNRYRPDLEKSAALRLSQMDALAESYLEHPERDERISAHFLSHVQQAGIQGGRVLEVGARSVSRAELLDQERFTYEVMDLDSDLGTIVGDITHCPEVPDESFDVVVSVDVFEHLTEPWSAAAEIVRILKPGGLSYTGTLFSWRYHPCPVDYWRFSPAGLIHLFKGLDVVDADFDALERRRDIRKKSRHDPFGFDAFGGWRENIRVYHVGRKPLEPSK